MWWLSFHTKETLFAQRSNTTVVMKDESGGDIKAELLETKLVVCVCIGHSWLDTVIWLLRVGSEIWVITSAPDTSLLRSQTNSVLSEKGAKCVSKVTFKGAPADGVGACWSICQAACKHGPVLYITESLPSELMAPILKSQVLVI